MRVYLVTTNYIKQYCFKSLKKAENYIKSQSENIDILFQTNDITCYIDKKTKQQYFINCYKPK